MFRRIDYMSRFRFLVFVALFFLQQGINAQSKTSEIIRNAEDIVSFYKNILSDSTSLETKDSLLRDILTPKMYDRLFRMSALVDCNQITRSQDGTGFASNSVSCQHLIGEWYEVSFRFAPNDTLCTIPLKIHYSKFKKKLFINYVVPEWGGCRYGDNLLKCPVEKVLDGQPNTLAFVKSFYERYISYYINMSSSLEKKLEALRFKYCTKEVLSQFEKYRKEYSLDGEPAYDLLIANADFDVFLKEMLRFKLLDDKTVEITYYGKKIVVTVQRKKGKLKIVNVSLYNNGKIE